MTYFNEVKAQNFAVSQDAQENSFEALNVSNSLAAGILQNQEPNFRIMQPLDGSPLYLPLDKETQGQAII